MDCAQRQCRHASVLWLRCLSSFHKSCEAWILLLILYSLSCFLVKLRPKSDFQMDLAPLQFWTCGTEPLQKVLRHDRRTRQRRNRTASESLWHKGMTRQPRNPTKLASSGASGKRNARTQTAANEWHWFDSRHDWVQCRQPRGRDSLNLDRAPLLIQLVFAGKSNILCADIPLSAEVWDPVQVQKWFVVVCFDFKWDNLTPWKRHARNGGSNCVSRLQQCTKKAVALAVYFWSAFHTSAHTNLWCVLGQGQLLNSPQG